MGLDFIICVKSEAGTLIDVQKCGNVGSRYYGPRPDPADGFYEAGNWPDIRLLIEDTRDQYPRDTIYYGSDHHDDNQFLKVTDKLITEINNYYRGSK